MKRPFEIKGGGGERRGMGGDGEWDKLRNAAGYNWVKVEIRKDYG